VGANGVLAHNAGGNKCKTESAKEYENRVMSRRGSKRDAWYEPNDPGGKGPFIRYPDGERGSVGHEVKHLNGSWNSFFFTPNT
jgi:hypothetical protein